MLTLERGFPAEKTTQDSGDTFEDRTTEWSGKKTLSSDFRTDTWQPKQRWKWRAREIVAPEVRNGDTTSIFSYTTEHSVKERPVTAQS